MKKYPLPPSTRSQRQSAFVFAVGVVLAVTAAIRLSSMADHPVLASSKRSREAGAVTFREKGCEHCHGVDGIGTDRGPELSDVGKRWHNERIERQIRDGGGGMPPFGNALSPDEIQSLVDLLHAKRKALPVVKKPEPQAPVKPSPDDSGL